MIMAKADFVVSAWLVAVIVMVCCDVIDAGAVYKPSEVTEPTPAGTIVHVTPTLFVFVTVAVSCWVCPP